MNRAAARPGDVLLGVVGAVVMAPLMLGIWLFVRLTTGEPAIFLRGYASIDGRRTRSYAFRADAGNAFGSVLRRTSLDRLPALVSLALGHIRAADLVHLR